MTFVLDASVTLSWLLRDAATRDAAYAFAVLKALRAGTAASVPMTWGLELSNVLARAEGKGQLTEAQSESFLEMLEATAIEADSATYTQALTDTLQLARRHRLSAYDASYLELALRSALPLATLDSDLRKAAGKAGVKLYKPA
ncbi:MAG: type II toxin-antitoxin system VapC family toxin [Proteobacteria bacterium]|nr:type II toxin-antitoxin system VapC family toxin [Pseudomonadota bacterium]